MAHFPDNSVIRIISTDGRSAGTGFLVSDDLAVTCAHVIRAVHAVDRTPGNTVEVGFYCGAPNQTATILTAGYSPTEEADVAFLRLEMKAPGSEPATLCSAALSMSHAARCLGYAGGSDNASWSSDLINGLLKDRSPHVLQFQSDRIEPGFSGAPVFDEALNRVVGMVSFGHDKRHTVVIHAVTADTIASLHPEIKLNPLSHPDHRFTLPERGTLPEPGQLPPGSRMLFSRNTLFTGRETDMLRLAERLVYSADPRTVAVPQPVAISGLGGIGKTQLAVEFCYRFGRFFDGVHWIFGDHPDQIRFEIAACGQRMGLPHWPDAIDKQISLTLHHWALTPNRIVVLDNLEEPAILNEWLPSFLSCRVLLTTRRANWPANLGIQFQPVELFQQTESLSVLRKRATRLQAVADSALAPIADRLGHLPLAIDLAGCYLEECTSCSTKEYLAEINQPGSVLVHPSQMDWTPIQESPTAHLSDLQATFAVSWQKIAGASTVERTAQDIFMAAGFCVPNAPIPMDLFRKTTAVNGIEGPVFDRALRRLVDLGLLTSTSDSLLIHPLLAEYAQFVGRGNRRIFSALAAAILDLAKEADSQGLPAQFRPFLPHLKKIAVLAEAIERETVPTLWLMLSNWQRNYGDFASAQSYSQQALSFLEQRYGPDHPKVAEAIYSLGLVAQKLGDFEDAKSRYEQALLIWEVAYGPNHPGVAMALSRLGMVLQHLADFRTAKAYCEQALTTLEQLYGADHPDVAKVLISLGEVFQNLGDAEEAKASFERALSILELVYPSGHPYIAIALSRLGETHQQLGNHEYAKDCCMRALSIQEMLYGSDHPDVASVINHLGAAFMGLGDLESAKDCYQRALTIFEQVYGAAHPEVSDAVYNLGEVFEAQGNLEEASIYYKRALLISEAVYGPDHPDVAWILAKLGEILEHLRDLEGAKTHAERSLAIFEAVNEPHHPGIRHAMIRLGEIRQTLGDYEGAKVCYERVLPIMEETLGDDHPDVATVVLSLGQVLQVLHDFEGAKACYERAQLIWEVNQGSDSPEVYWVTFYLGTLFAELGDYKNAKAHFEGALEHLERIYGSDHPDITTILFSLADVLTALNDFQGAKANYEKGISILEKTDGSGAPEIANGEIRLGMAFLLQSDFRKARTCFARALSISENTNGPDHPDSALALLNLGRVLILLEEIDEARVILKRALSLLEYTYGSDSPWVAQVLTMWGTVQHKQGNLEGATVSVTRAISIYERIYGPVHPLIAQAVYQLGWVQQSRGNVESAKSYYHQAIVMLEQVYGSEHVNIAEIANTLGGLLGNQGDFEGAIANYEHALLIYESLFGREDQRVMMVFENIRQVKQLRRTIINTMVEYKKELATYLRTHPENAPEANKLKNKIAELEKLVHPRSGKQPD